MKKLGSITELVSVVFRKNSQQVTLNPNATTTYTNNRAVQLPEEDASGVLMSATSPATMTNKTFDANGAGNSLSNVEPADFKAEAGDANKVLLRAPTTGAVTSALVANANISTSAAIEVSKLSAGSDSQVLTTVSGVPTWSAASGGSVPNPTTMTDAEATRLGYKVYSSNTAYNSGITPTVTGSVDGSISNATLIPYQVQDGNWRLRGVIPGAIVGFYTNLGTGFNGVINALEAQTDGKILVGGTFTTLNGATRNRLVRLNSSGTEDTDFLTNINTGANSTVNTLTIQSDGKIIVAGDFLTFNGTTRTRMVRLNSNGTEDTAFYTNLGTGFGSQVQAVAIQSDGKILVGGGFTTLNGITRNRLVRLNSNGTEDTAFYTNLGTGFGSSVLALAIQSDGKILVGGIFTTLNGTTRNYLVRLNSDGTHDAAFYTNLGTGFNAYTNSLAIQSDGKILVGGNFTTLNGTTRNYLVRLNSDGTVDTAFYANLGTGFNALSRALRVQSDGKIIVAGDFTTLNGTTRNYLVRLNSDGTVDTAFYTNMGAGFGTGANTVNTVTIQSDGKILVGGSLSLFKGSTRNRLVRLNSSGTEDDYVTYTYTVNGVNFLTQQSANAHHGLSTTTSESNVITGGPWSGFLISQTGCTFDVGLAAKPTWAY